jgi:hypothetical protein
MRTNTGLEIRAGLLFAVRHSEPLALDAEQQGVLSGMQEDAVERGLPVPEAKARQLYLGEHVEAPDLAAPKTFPLLHRYVSWEDPPRLNQHLCRVVLRRLHPCYRHTDQGRGREGSLPGRYPFHGAVRIQSHGCQWVQVPLIKEGLLVNVNKPKHNFSLEDLTRIQG